MWKGQVHSVPHRSLDLPSAVPRIQHLYVNQAQCPQGSLSTSAPVVRVEPGEVGAFDHSGKSGDLCVAKSAISEMEASSCHAVVGSEPYEILAKSKKWKLILLGTWHWQYSLLTQRQCQHLPPGRTFPGPSCLAKKWYPDCRHSIAVPVKYPLIWDFVTQVPNLLLPVLASSSWR